MSPRFSEWSRTKGVGSLEEMQLIVLSFARIDVLVNNGAIGGQRAPFHEKTLDEYDSVMSVK
jgi:NAD(P)-dependent dehydrogenase (short-subunit alcohol dehydrogenase family)